MLPPIIIATLVWLAVINAITAGLYAWDKRAARRNAWRVSEAKLLAFSAVGGWPAAVFVSRRLRHKTAKRSFRLKFAASVVTNLTMIAVLVWLIARQ